MTLDVSSSFVCQMQNFLQPLLCLDQSHQLCLCGSD